MKYNSFRSRNLFPEIVHLICSDILQFFFVILNDISRGFFSTFKPKSLYCWPFFLSTSSTWWCCVLKEEFRLRYHIDVGYIRPEKGRNRKEREQIQQNICLFVVLLGLSPSFPVVLFMWMEYSSSFLTPRPSAGKQKFSGRQEKWLPSTMTNVYLVFTLQHNFAIFYYICFSCV